MRRSENSIMSDMINTSQCKNCLYATINETKKADVKIYCNIKNKTYHWGQYNPCQKYKGKGDVI